MKMVRENGSPSSPKEIQMEWSCALCHITTTSENCLKMHLQGRKHALIVEALQGETQGPISEYKSSVKPKRTSEGITLRANIQRPIRFCSWKKPEDGWTKLNTDGGKAGAGGLLRNSKGEPICAFVSKRLAADFIYLVELKAILFGLGVASRRGIKALWIESDSLGAVNTINRVQPCSSKARSCLDKIWELLKKFDEYRVTHTLRETNRAADYLAKMVLSESDPQVVVLSPGDFPDSLDRIIKDDAEGRSYCRI